MPISNLMSMSTKCYVFAASACTSSNSLSPRDLVSNSCILSSLPWLFHVYFTRSLSAWGSFLSSDLLNRIDSILRKVHKFGYTNEVLKVTDMLQNADNKLFSLMFRSSHCLHTLLPDLKVTDIVIRNSGTIALICLAAVINCTVILSTDVLRLLLICFALWDIYVIWSDLIYHFFST